MTDFIYFIRPIGAAGPIKIGVSANPRERLTQIQANSPLHLELVVQTRGGLILERQIQNCLANSHSHGEWFDFSPKLEFLILTLLQGEPLETAIDLSKPEGNAIGKMQMFTMLRNGTAGHQARSGAKRGAARKGHPNDLSAKAESAASP